jgi:D-alanyl-D-alanine carboxypeptidase
MDRRSFLVGGTSAGVFASGAKARLVSHSKALDQGLQARLDRALLPFVAARDFSGVVIMTRGGTTVAERIYGKADFERGRPNTLDTRFCCDSIGKSFTRAAIVALEKQGRLSQEDPLARFVPDFPNGANISLRQLIEHRSGITRELNLGADAQRVIPLPELVARIAKLPLEGSPGKQYFYSNNGYRMLALVVERAGHGDYGALVRELVFQPRRMDETIELRLGQSAPNVAKGYIAGPGLRTLDVQPPIELLNFRGAGSFYSSPRDLLTFAQSLPLQAADLKRPLEVVDGVTPRRVLGHDGLGFGFANLCFRYPEQDATLIMCCNIETPIFTPLHSHLEKLLFGEPAEPLPVGPVNVARFDPERAQLYAGQYELFPGTPLIIREEKAALWVSAGGDVFAPLVPLGPDRFFMRQKYAYLDFKVADGKTQSVKWSEHGRTFDLRKLS